MTTTSTPVVPTADWVEPAAMLADLHPTYHRLLESSPVAWVPAPAATDGDDRRTCGECVPARG